MRLEHGPHQPAAQRFAPDPCRRGARERGSQGGNGQPRGDVACGVEDDGLAATGEAGGCGRQRKPCEKVEHHGRAEEHADEVGREGLHVVARDAHRLAEEEAVVPGTPVGGDDALHGEERGHGRDQPREHAHGRVERGHARRRRGPAGAGAEAQRNEELRSEQPPDDGRCVSHVQRRTQDRVGARNVHLALAEVANRQQFLGAGVIGNLQSGFLLNH